MIECTCAAPRSGMLLDDARKRLIQRPFVHFTQYTI